MDGVTFTPLLFDGTPLLPSAVFAETGGELSVGRDALHSVRLDPARFEPNPKRRIDDGSVLLGDREIGVVDMIAAVLVRVGEEFARVNAGAPAAVSLTYPAAWGSIRQLALVDAAAKAGMTMPRLIAEPVAAATYFAGARRQLVPVGSAVVVADFGGGTFDCSLVRRTEAGFEVVNVDGHDQLGGIDVDEAVVAHLRRRLQGEAEWGRLSAPKTDTDRRHRRNFYDDARSAKELLSRRQNVDVHVPVFDRDVHLTRAELESVAGPLLERAAAITAAVIRLSAAAHDGIAGLYLVGGGSRMPLAATMLHRATGLAPMALEQPELVVAQGALLHAMSPQAPPAPVPPVFSVPAGPVPGAGSAGPDIRPRTDGPAGSPVQATTAGHPTVPGPPAPVGGIHAGQVPAGSGYPQSTPTAAPRRRPALLWVVLGLIAVQMSIAGVGAVFGYLHDLGFVPPLIISGALAVPVTLLARRRLAGLWIAAVFELGVMAAAIDVPPWAQGPMLAEVTIAILVVTTLGSLLKGPKFWASRNQAP